MASLTLISSNKCFGGLQKVFSHASDTLKCKMNFGIFIPASSGDGRLPLIYWLSGLTCTEQNFVTKAGAQQFAARHGVAIVAPDTSPRGCNIEGEDDSYDLGTGAGFYVDATEDKWSKNYLMYSYITKELPAVLKANFSDEVDVDKCSIMGHSMGGHGALVFAMKNPGMYASVSAFSPICNPTRCPWGKKAFTAYLGPDEKAWQEYDATCLVSRYCGPPLNILIDQGKSDQFLADQLLPANLVQACAANKIPIVLRQHEGYDHSYFFIATFIGDHIEHHAQKLKM